MQFQDHRLLPRAAFPICALPAIVLIDDFACTAHVVWLKSRSRIGNFEYSVDPELVASAHTCVAHEKFEPAIVYCRHCSSAVQQEINPIGSRSPKAKSHSAVAFKTRTKAVMRIHAASANTVTDRAGALHSSPG